MRLEFTVGGRPIAQPRPRFNRRTGGVYSNNDRVASWKASVQMVAMQEAGAGYVMPSRSEALMIGLTFFLPGRPDAPTTPDVDNLAKAVLDALQGVLYIDDKQIVALSASKIWVGREPRTGVHVSLCDMNLEEIQ